MTTAQDYWQGLTLAIYVVCLVLGTRRRMYQGYWLSLFIYIAHSVVFYAVIMMQKGGLVYDIPTMIWSVGLRLHLGLVILGYMIHRMATDGR